MDSLGLRKVVTSASGNCLAIAIVQGATGKYLAEPTSKLGQLTATLKTGIKEETAYRMTFGSRCFKSCLENHDAAGISWPTQMVFEDYASSPSERKAVVADNTWGGNGVIGLAAMLLRQNIYVLESEDTRANP
ncbi:unnamed protein product [Peronospora belbahrii]|uniref:Uncharacterized protein n=1 Tax=Peronospora belbahrii TaxID=622444 RepID=A0ABN8CXF3_9STRA|nr:unnamed protein product [Peronospora belbahrii]